MGRRASERGCGQFLLYVSRLRGDSVQRWIRSDHEPSAMASTPQKATPFPCGPQNGAALAVPREAAPPPPPPATSDWSVPPGADQLPKKASVIRPVESLPEPSATASTKGSCTCLYFLLFVGLCFFLWPVFWVILIHTWVFVILFLDGWNFSVKMRFGGLYMLGFSA